MSKKSFERIFFYALSAFIIGIFCYFRLKPLYYQTVGYTYDQGRDFFAAATMVLTKNILLIGPTTGIIGLNHGAWWYYLLTIPFLLFKGAPIGYYYFNFFIQLSLHVKLMRFVKKHFNGLSALIAGFIVATSHYFIFTSVFVGNNVMVIPTLLFFLVTNFHILQENHGGKKIERLLFFAGLWLGFVGEFEVAYGLFLIPAYGLTVLLLPRLRHIFFASRKHLFVFLAGFAIPFIPRLLFEVTHFFAQTKALGGFILKNRPSTTPQPLKHIVGDRIELFIHYFRSLFANDLLVLIFFLVSTVLLVTLILYRKSTYGAFLKFLGMMLGILFLFSIIHKDFFWANYYEGIQYMYLFVILILLNYAHEKAAPFSHLRKSIMLGTLFFVSLFIFVQELTRPTHVKLDGLRLQQKTVNTLLTQVSAQPFYCSRVYTPPVIPHTYNYLFLYQKIAHNKIEPDFDWVNRQCWMIIERDPFIFRAEKWRQENIPTGSTMLKQIIISPEVMIELWQLPQ